MAELVDAADSKSVARKGVLVRVRPGAPTATIARVRSGDFERLLRPQNGNPNIIRELEPFSEPELLTDALAQPARTSRPSKRLNANRERM